MTDPIKAALDAAAVMLVAEGMQSLMPEEPNIRDHWIKQPATREARRQVAAAIAAFLRALPAIEVDLQTGGTVGFWSRRVALFAAAAVEEAARHD